MLPTQQVEKQLFVNENAKTAISLGDTNGHYFDERGGTSRLPATLADSHHSIDDAAVFSVLQMGAIIPPFSPWKSVHRKLPGYRYQGLEALGPVAFSASIKISGESVEQQADHVERVLDFSLQRCLNGTQNPVLLFSGGVDSGIIASRLVALGYKDCLLVNYRFGENDRESQLAEAMANHLGLKFVSLSPQRRQQVDCLCCPGKIYPQPFGDHSTVPTSDLARAVNEYLGGESRVILDGTGADGAFGMTGLIKKWQRLMCIPSIVRKGVSLGYGDFLWHRPGRCEYVSRVFRRSLTIPLPAAAIAQNPLAGIFYRDTANHAVHEALHRWISSIAGNSWPLQVVAADLAIVCANIYAQKAKPVLESAGHRVAYPFLDDEMIGMALASSAEWKMDEPKAPLKRALSRHVPREMVYRPKSGFADPEGGFFLGSEFVAYLRTAADSTSPIAHLLMQKPLLKACDLLAAKHRLPDQTLGLLWAVVFTDRWYRTVF